MVAAVLLILLMAALIAASFIAARHEAELERPQAHEDDRDDLVELPH